MKTLHATCTLREPLNAAELPREQANESPTLYEVLTCLDTLVDRLSELETLRNDVARQRMVISTRHLRALTRLGHYGVDE
jgi:hypothetical protein